MSDQKFDPMRELSNLRNTVGKAIEQGIQQVQAATTPQSQIRVDVYELEDSVIVRTSPIDGIVANSIEVSMEGEILSIRGETRPDDTPAAASYLLQERRFGQFLRTVPISIPVKSKEAKAKLKNGILTITLPVDTDQYQDIDVTSLE